jgi:hypothetical protein
MVVDNPLPCVDKVGGTMGLRACKNSSSTLHPKQSKPETAFYNRQPAE